MALLDPALSRWLVVAGWSAVVIVWHTTLIALALSIWHTWRRSGAPTSHRSALLALLACAVLTAATPFVLKGLPSFAAVLNGNLARNDAMATLPQGTGPDPAPVLSPANPQPLQILPSLDVDDPGFSTVAAAIGGLWIVGSTIALLRIAGGWMLALWIRRRATPVTSASFKADFEKACESWHQTQAVLLVSTHVEAPVVVGHWSPAILLPVDAAEHLNADAMIPLLTHELAHIARSDYAINLAQSVIEALLFLSPGVHWISRRIRDSREYCCDDLVVDRCGHKSYVAALTTLAGLSAAGAARPVLNVAGPRLITRIRRLLQEDVMSHVSVTRLVGQAGGLLLAVAAGVAVLPISAAAVAASVQPQIQPASVPRRYISEPVGSSIFVESIQTKQNAVCASAVIRNDADVAVVGVRFGALLSTMRDPTPLAVVFSDEIPVRVAPGASATVDPGLLTAADMPRQTIRGDANDPQALCALSGVRFANGYEWRIGREQLMATNVWTPLELSREMIGKAPDSNRPGLCIDQNSKASGPGLLLPVRHEPGRWAVCGKNGVWEYDESFAARLAP
jgi:beta-lactamase regulating signal transducer with metallopeptidase domain